MTALLDNHQTLQPGTIVRILFPQYVAGDTGKILSPAIVEQAETSDYWLVKVCGEEMVLALLPDEFQILRLGEV